MVNEIHITLQEIIDIAKQCMFGGLGYASQPQMILKSIISILENNEDQYVHIETGKLVSPTEPGVCDPETLLCVRNNKAAAGFKLRLALRLIFVTKIKLAFDEFMSKQKLKKLVYLVELERKFALISRKLYAELEYYLEKPKAELQKQIQQDTFFTENNKIRVEEENDSQDVATSADRDFLVSGNEDDSSRNYYRTFDDGKFGKLQKKSSRTKSNPKPAIRQEYDKAVKSVLRYTKPNKTNDEQLNALEMKRHNNLFKQMQQQDPNNKKSK